MSSLVGAQGTTFQFQDGSNTYTLKLRHNPYSINWTYNLITHVQDTYAGQVIQLLGVNIDKIVIEGQLGIEGAFGKDITADGRIVDRDRDRQFDWTGKYPGLHAMTEFFRRYFSTQAQGTDDSDLGRFAQTPMSVFYNVDSAPDARHWPKIVPVNFPSFRRSWENYAPMWRIEAYVIEADATILPSVQKQALQRLQQGIGYKIANPFSDPNASNPDILATVESLYTGFRSLLPHYSPQQLQELIWNDVSRPVNDPFGAITTQDVVFAGEVK